jgi:branched-subunit amino acid transport protein
MSPPIWSVVIAMGVANLVIRVLPFAALSRVRLPAPIERWLSFVPVSVLAALVVGEIARPGGEWMPPLANPYLWAAVPTALVYLRWRSFMGATLTGVASFLLIRWLMGG